MKRSRELNFLVHRGVTLDDVDVANNCASLFVCQFESRGVGDPSVNSSSSRIDPEDMLEPEIGCER